MTDLHLVYDRGVTGSEEKKSIPKMLTKKNIAFFWQRKSILEAQKRLIKCILQEISLT